MHIVDAIHHLMEVGPCHSLCEFASFSHEIEKLTSACILKNDGETAQRRLIRLLIERLFFDRD